MTKNLLEPQPAAPAEKTWRRWKWIGLALFAVVMVFGRWLPGLLVFLGYLYGIVVIANLLFLAFRYLKNRLFWRVRNRLIGSFIFVGVIPLVLLFGIIFMSGYVLLGQLAGRYLENSLQEEQHQLTDINKEIASRLPALPSDSALGELASSILSDHAGEFSRVAVRLLRKNSAASFEVGANWDPAKIVGKGAKPDAPASWLAGFRSYEGLIRIEQSLLMASLNPVPKTSDLYLMIWTPVDSFVEQRMQREKSIYFTLIGVGRPKVFIKTNMVQVSVDEENTPKKRTEEADLRELQGRRKGDLRRMVAWGMVLDSKDYLTGKTARAAVSFWPSRFLSRNFRSSKFRMTFQAHRIFSQSCFLPILVACHKDVSRFYVAHVRTEGKYFQCIMWS
jgi:hypothetical protein